MNYDRFLNPSIVAVPPSGIRRFFDLAASMKDTISLGVGEPDFKTPYPIRDAAINSLIDGETQYTANRGLSELRQEIAFYLMGRYGLEYDPARQIIVTIGASEAIDIALRAVLSPGDEVLVPEPSYVSYAPGVVFAGGTPLPVVTRQEDEFRLLPEDLDAAITSRTKALILPYPNNPTGAIMERKNLEALLPVILRHDLLVISDEIYSELIYDGKEHVSFATLPDMYPRTLTINGFSKSFAMTGWRVGYIPPKFVKGFRSSMSAHFGYIPCVADSQIYVTDNPYSHTDSIGLMEAGESFHVLSRYNYYAKEGYDWWYIECYIDGQVARGFIDVNEAFHVEE